MPCFGTTDHTYRNALTLMDTLGVTRREIPIHEAVRLHFRDIGHQESDHSVTYENAQARERTQVLMDVANQTGGIVLGTASMLDGMIDRYRAELGEDLTVIATGGLAKSITALCHNDMVLDENLVLEGLRILFQKNTK